MNNIIWLLVYNTIKRSKGVCVERDERLLQQELSWESDMMESALTYICLLETQLSLLFLELISLCSRGGPVLGLLCGSRLSQTLVYQSLLIVASACGFVHEALCVAFFESGNNVFASWETGVRRKSGYIIALRRHGFLRRAFIVCKGGCILN